MALLPLEPPPSPRRDWLNLALAILLCIAGTHVGGFLVWAMRWSAWQ